MDLATAIATAIDRGAVISLSPVAGRLDCPGAEHFCGGLRRAGAGVVGAIGGIVAA